MGLWVTYAVEREVIRVAAGEVEVLAVELEAVPLDRHEPGRGCAGGRCGYRAGGEVAEQDDTEAMQHHLHHYLSSMENSVDKHGFIRSRGREIYIACGRT